MNILSKTYLLSFLTMGNHVVLAEASKQSVAMNGESSATLQALPSVDVILGRQGDTAQKWLTIEGLWPFFYKEQQLLFLQGGMHRQQQRNLLSLGLGWRYFPEVHWGLGYNLFYDQETKRQQRRLGVGGEAWWRSLTLAVNGYLPVNGWKSAHDLTGYRQRTASGYDATLRGYLPALPHLGVSLRTVRYWGHEVALANEQQSHRNPQQCGWGVSYTPVPLLTLAYQRHADSSNTKHQISAVLSYHFSLPLFQQLDPQKVFVLHSAEGQRLARVQRERMIVVKYAKIADPAEAAVKELEAAVKVAVKELQAAEKAVKELEAAEKAAIEIKKAADKKLKEKVESRRQKEQIFHMLKGQEGAKIARKEFRKATVEADTASEEAKAASEQAAVIIKIKQNKLMVARAAVKKLEQLRKKYKNLNSTKVE